MQTIWPAYEGSVRTSWYPVIAVLKTTSPSPMTSAPSGAPTKARPSSSTSAANDFLGSNDHHLVEAVFLVDQNFDPLGVRGRHVLAHVVRADWQLPMTAIDQYRELNRARPAKVHQRIHRGACSPPVVDHVIDEHDDLAVDHGHVARRPLAVVRSQVEVVAMARDVELPERNIATFECCQHCREPSGQDVALADDPDQHHVLGASIALDDLVRHARQRASDLVGVHHCCFEPP